MTQSLFYSTALVEVVALAVTELPLEYYAERLHINGAVALINSVRHLTHADSLSLSIPPVAVLGWALGVSGTLLRVWCYRTLAKAFTFELSVKEGHKLVRSGPYAFVRHPSYTGYYALMVGAAIFTYGRGGWWAQIGFHLGGWPILAGAHLLWQSVLMASFWGRCGLEDKVLHAHFKEEWETWEKEVPYRLIPGVI